MDTQWSGDTCMHACTHAHWFTHTHKYTHTNARPTTGWNCMESTHSIHIQNPLSHELGSEWTKKWSQRSAQVKGTVRKKQMSVGCEWTSERTSKWPSTLRVDFIVFLPIVWLKWVCGAAMTTDSKTLAYTRTHTRAHTHTRAAHSGL